ncbi:unnamed protein product [Closterium sp. NIES-64]|nr:unnamed protein product [Closterium sp. NIES-64]
MLAVGCAAHLALPSAFGAPTFPAPAQDPIGSVILPAVAGVLAGFGSQVLSGVCVGVRAVCVGVRGCAWVCGGGRGCAGGWGSGGGLGSGCTSGHGGVRLAAPLHPQLCRMSAASLLLLLVRSLVSLPAPPSVAKDEAAVPGAVPPVLLLSSLLSGAVFAARPHLQLNPAKVKAFLDPIHGWDPSLAFVMGGAVLFNLIAFHFVLKQRHPLLAPSFALPTRKEITRS